MIYIYSSSSCATNFLFLVSKGFLEKRNKDKLTKYLLLRNQEIRRKEIKISTETNKRGKKESDIKPRASSIF